MHIVGSSYKFQVSVLKTHLRSFTVIWMNSVLKRLGEMLLTWRAIWTVECLVDLTDRCQPVHDLQCTTATGRLVDTLRQDRHDDVPAATIKQHDTCTRPPLATKRTRNLVIANRSRVSCAHNTSRASIVTPRLWNLGQGRSRSLKMTPFNRSHISSY